MLNHAALEDILCLHSHKRTKTVLFVGMTNNLEQRIVELISKEDKEHLSLENTMFTFSFGLKHTNMSTMQSQEKMRLKHGE